MAELPDKQRLKKALSVLRRAAPEVTRLADALDANVIALLAQMKEKP